MSFTSGLTISAITPATTKIRTTLRAALAIAHSRRRPSVSAIAWIQRETTTGSTRAGGTVGPTSSGRVSSGEGAPADCSGRPSASVGCVIGGLFSAIVPQPLWRAARAGYAPTHVPKHPNAPQLRSTRHRAGDPLRLAPVRPQGERSDQALAGECRSLRLRGRSRRRSHSRPPRRAGHIGAAEGPRGRGREAPGPRRAALRGGVAGIVCDPSGVPDGPPDSEREDLAEVLERRALTQDGGRPGDVDYPVVSALDTRAFALWARLSGLVPRIAVVAGRCFAGNAVIAGCSDLIVATENVSIGMGGPAMIEGGGLGKVDPNEVGPIDMQSRNGVVDFVARDESEATDVTKRVLAYFQGRTPPGPEPDQTRLRSLIPERHRRAYAVAPIIEILADEGSVTFLRERFAPEMVTALVRIEGRPVGVIANDTRYMAGAITSDAGDKAARFMQLCDAFGIPLLSLVDTPGLMVGPEAEATGLVRHPSRLLVAGGALRVPLVAGGRGRGYGAWAPAVAAGRP